MKGQGKFLYHRSRRDAAAVPAPDVEFGVVAGTIAANRGASRPTGGHRGRPGTIAAALAVSEVSFRVMVLGVQKILCSTFVEIAFFSLSR